MKRIAVFFLALTLVLGLAACGKSAPADLSALYTQMEEYLPEMIVLDDSFRMSLLGIDANDCSQVITAVCGEGLRADEVWLIEAKDSAALARIKTLAESRMQGKADETESYVPEQYLIVKQGQILTKGLYLALLVSPEIGAMQSIFEDTIK